MTDGEEEEDIGYGNPPASTRFKKGQSGNPQGRPCGSQREAPYEAVLGQVVTIREEGIERQVTAAEAFLLQIAKQGLEGDGAAARSAMAVIEKARAERQGELGHPKKELVIQFVRAGAVTGALEALRMAKKLDRYREKTARMALEPWIVEAALARLGDRRLSLEEQKIILNATRSPKKVRWPNWWDVKP